MGDPQQEIFSALLVRLREAGYTVYDGTLPPEAASYPFIYMAESQQVDTPHKSGAFGTVYQTVDIWHNQPEQRGTVSSMLLAAKHAAGNIENTQSYGWYLAGVDQRIQPDTTTKQPLLRGILELEFRFS